MAKGRRGPNRKPGYKRKRERQNVRTVRYSFCISPKERENLRAQAQFLNTTPSDLIRKCLRHIINP